VADRYSLHDDCSLGYCRTIFGSTGLISTSGAALFSTWLALALRRWRIDIRSMTIAPWLLPDDLRFHRFEFDFRRGFFLHLAGSSAAEVAD
jgi:hypothetical protein